MTKRAASLVCSLLLAPFLLSHSWGASSCVVIHPRALFDSRKGLFRKGHYIRIENGRIKSLSSGRPRGIGRCEIHELPSQTLLPGLIDSHTHLMITERDFLRKPETAIATVSAERLALRQSEAVSYLRETLYSGVTSVRDLGNSGVYEELLLREQVAQGKLPGPRIFGSGPGLVVGEGQFPPGTPVSEASKEYRIVGSVLDARAAVVEHAKRKTDWIKAYADNDPNPGTMPKEVLEAIVRAAHETGLKVALHATTSRSAELGVSAGVDSIEHGAQLSDRTLAEMARKKIYLVPTDFSRSLCDTLIRNGADPSFKADSCPARSSDRLKRAFRRGVPIAFGSDFYYDLKNGLSRGENAKETLVSYVEQGLSPTEALRAATLNAASLLGRRDLGVLEPGATADLIGVEGDPGKSIQAIQNVTLVMKEGSVVCNSKESCRAKGIGHHR